MDNTLTRTLRSSFVVAMGLVGIALGNRVYGRQLLQDLVRARRTDGLLWRGGRAAGAEPVRPIPAAPLCPCFAARQEREEALAAAAARPSARPAADDRQR